MILWIFAVCLLAALGLVGYYQGAIRAAFSLVGLLVAAALAMPLAVVVKPIFPVFGLTHPVLSAFLAPAIVYLVILIAFKSTALAVHKKVDNHYKYKASDTQRLLWERVNERLGICVGLANATVYLFLLAMVAYVFGYFTVQVASPDKDGTPLRVVNYISDALQSTLMDKAVAPIVPASEDYFDGADVVGDIYRNPLLQSRLSSYPPFLSLLDRSEFKNIANDVEFQERFWFRQPRPSFDELVSHDKLKPLIQNVDLFTNIVGLVETDLKDLKGYLETGKSAKYDDEKILGHWEFDFKESLGRAKRAKSNMTLAELRWARAVLGRMANGTFTAMIDNRATLKVPSTNTVQTLHGTWKSSFAGRYLVSLNEVGKTLDVPVVVDANRLIMTKDNYALVFEK